MDRRTRREILWMARESLQGRLWPWNPRHHHGRRLLESWWFALVSAGDLGAVIVILIPTAISYPLALVARSAWGSHGFNMTLLISIGITVLLALRQIWIVTHRQRRLVSQMKRDEMVCLWCHHPLTEEIRRGVCPECGLAYDADVNRRLITMTLNPQRPTTRVFIRRAAKLWARAVILRNRSVDRAAPG